MTSKTTPTSASSLRKAGSAKADAVTPDRKKRLVIYTSGDVTSQAICQLIIDKGVPFERRDIRKAIPGEGLRDLKFLQKLGLQTVPQLFDEDGRHIGGFDESRLYLVQIPDPVKGLATA